VNKKLLALYGLKWNPFAPDVPAEALHITPRIESFCWRVEQLAREGGFALVSGGPGTGKSVTLRILCERKFNVQISDDEYTPENFSSVRKIATLVLRLKDG